MINARSLIKACQIRGNIMPRLPYIFDFDITEEFIVIKWLPFHHLVTGTTRSDAGEFLAYGISVKYQLIGRATLFVTVTEYPEEARKGTSSLDQLKDRLRIDEITALNI